MKSGPLEGPGEAHGSVLLNDVGIGLLAFGTFPRLHWSVGPGIHSLNPRKTRRQEDKNSEWLMRKRVPILLPSQGPFTVGQTQVKL